MRRREFVCPFFNFVGGKEKTVNQPGKVEPSTAAAQLPHVICECRTDLRYVAAKKFLRANPSEQAVWFAEFAP